MKNCRCRNICDDGIDYFMKQLQGYDVDRVNIAVENYMEANSYSNSAAYGIGIISIGISAVTLVLSCFEMSLLNLAWAVCILIVSYAASTFVLRISKEKKSAIC